MIQQGATKMDEQIRPSFSPSSNDDADTNSAPQSTVLTPHVDSDSTPIKVTVNRSTPPQSMARPRMIHDSVLPRGPFPTPVQTKAPETKEPEHQPQYVDIAPEPAAGPSQGASAVGAPVFSDEPAPKTALADMDLSDFQDNPAPERPQTPLPPVSHHRKGRRMAVIATILVLLALVGGAAFAYIQNKDKVVKAPAAAAPASTTPAKSPATSTDVDKASTSLDNSLKKVDDTKDQSEADLSDITLGL